jgi:hypothetical protein
LTRTLLCRCRWLNLVPSDAARRGATGGFGISPWEDDDTRYFCDTAAPPARLARSVEGVVSARLQCDPRSPHSDKFPAEIHLWKLGGLAMSRTSAPPVNIVRTKGHLRRDPVITGSSAIARGARTLPRLRVPRSKHPPKFPTSGRWARISARADACRPGSVLPGTRRAPGSCASARCGYRVNSGRVSRTSVR